MHQAQHSSPCSSKTPISQVVMYGPGIGSSPGLASFGEGMTGAGLATKVEEAYSFIAGNYEEGDEVQARSLF